VRTQICMYLIYTDPHCQWGSCLSVASKNSKSPFQVIKATINEWCRDACLVWVGNWFWSSPLVYSQRHFGAQFLRLDFYSMCDSNVPLSFAKNWGKLGASDVENKGEDCIIDLPFGFPINNIISLKIGEKDPKWDRTFNSTIQTSDESSERTKICFKFYFHWYQICTFVIPRVCSFVCSTWKMMKTPPQIHRVSRNKK